MAALDPYTATREECTRHLLGVPFASNTTDDWERQAMYLQDLLRLLAYHPAMIDTGNLAQTYMTPALSKNKIYSTLEAGGEAFNDIIGRGVLAAQLLLDSKPGALDMLVESSYPNQTGSIPVIGNDLKAAARDLTHDG